MKLLIVPNENKILDALVNKTKQLCEDHETYYLNHEELINQIEYKSRSGFMPYTNGGFTVSIPIPFDYPKFNGNLFKDNDIQDIYDKYLDSTQKDIFETLGVKDFEEVRVKRLLEEYDKLEQEYCSEDVFFLDIHLHYYDVENTYNRIGKDSIYIWYGVNFDSYGRSKHSNIINDKDFEFDKTNDIIEFINQIEF